MSSTSMSSGSQDSRRSSSGSRQSKGSEVLEFNHEDKQRFVSDTVFYIVVQEQKKIPFKRSEVLRAVGLNAHSKEQQEVVFRIVKRKLIEIFGFEMTELPDDKNTFILVNKVGPTENPKENHLHWMKHETLTHGLLNVILSAIFMSGGMIHEEKLVSFLTKLGLGGGDQDGDTPGNLSEAFTPGGNVKQYIDRELAGKQRYLEIKKVEGGDAENPIVEYRWGDRAKLEVKKSEILRYVSKVYKCNPEVFTEQYEEVKRLEPDAVFDEDQEPMDQDAEDDGDDDD